MDYDAVAKAIFDGLLDNDLSRISDIINARKSAVAQRALIGLRPGDTIRFSNNTRPIYLRGLKASVKKVNGSSVVVDVASDPSYGRYAGVRNVRVPASLVERIERI